MFQHSYLLAGFKVLRELVTKPIVSLRYELFWGSGEVMVHHAPGCPIFGGVSRLIPLQQVPLSQGKLSLPFFTRALTSNSPHYQFFPLSRTCHTAFTGRGIPFRHPSFSLSAWIPPLMSRPAPLTQWPSRQGPFHVSLSPCCMYRGVPLTENPPALKWHCCL